ncbi:MAG: glycosyltransferase family 2 protein [Dysgonomonadaceae bacterium]|nr:glycosyltransferase family 2 protein [Dysgonamonadaceae bacterium]
MNSSNSAEQSICVIIVSYNFETWIDRCIPSIQASTLPATILVVDNASQDRTCEIIRNRYPEVILIENKENLGFGKANNIGMRYALGKGFDYVFLLNQDAWLEPNALEKLVNASLRYPVYGILSPIHFNGDGTALDFGFATYTGLKNPKDIELSSEIEEFPFINAAMWLIPTEVIRKVGGFAPIFTHYGEDRNLAQRIRKNGYKIGVVKSASGYHDREARPINQKIFFYSEYVYFLTEAVNPFYSFAKAFAYSVLAAYKKAVKSWASREIIESREYIRIVFRLIGKTPAIFRTRKETRKNQSNCYL